MQEAREIWPAHPSVGLELEKLSKLYRSQGRIRAADFLNVESQKLKVRMELGGNPDPGEMASLTGVAEPLDVDAIHSTLRVEIEHIT